MFGIMEGSIQTKDFTMSYLTFGRGQRNLVILPGLSDGLQTVAGQGLSLAFFFRKYWKDFKLYIFSRREDLPEKFTVRQMATDVQQALDYLQIESYALMGFSQGGMIAQELAAMDIHRLQALVLAVTTAYPQAMSRRAVRGWIRWAKAEKFGSLLIDTLERTYSKRRLRWYRLFYPWIRRLTRSSQKDRFIRQAESILTHDARSRLGHIQCPTLVVSGSDDAIIPYQDSQFLAQTLPDAYLLAIESHGHGAYEEFKYFDYEVIQFLLKKSRSIS